MLLLKSFYNIFQIFNNIFISIKKRKNLNVAIKIKFYNCIFCTVRIKRLNYIRNTLLYVLLTDSNTQDLFIKCKHDDLIITSLM